MNLQRTDKEYEKTKFKVQNVDKAKVIEPKIALNIDKDLNIDVTSYFIINNKKK